MKSNLQIIRRKSFWERLHPETKIWVNKIKANSGTISQNSILTGDLFIRESYTDGDRALFKYVNLYLGDQLAARLCPIIDDVGAGVAINNNFVAEDSDELGGLGNATNSSKYVNLNFVPSAIGNPDNFHIACYINDTVPTGTTRLAMGCNSSVNNDVIRLGKVSSGTLNGATIGTSTGVNEASVASSMTADLYIASRLAANDISIFKGNSSIATNTGTATLVTNSTIKIASNCMMANTSPGSYFQGRIWLTSAGLGLNADAVDRFYTRVLNLKTRMGR